MKTKYHVFSEREGDNDNDIAVIQQTGSNYFMIRRGTKVKSRKISPHNVNSWLKTKLREHHIVNTPEEVDEILFLWNI